jgi:cobalt-zinc-cadmium resistance protein CzcA
MVLSMTLMPVLVGIFLPRRVSEREPLLMTLAHAIHTPILALCLRFKAAVLLFAAAVLVFAFGLVAPNLGAEFTPKLSEGAISINIVRPAGTDIGESVRQNTLIEKAILKEFPDEVAHVWSRIGSADVATDPMGVELTDTYVTLKPRDQWKRAATQDELTEQLEALARTFPGLKGEFSQPIEMRVNEMDTGIRSEVGVLVYGDDFPTLLKTAGEVEKVLNGIAGVADLRVEQVTGQPVLQVKVRQDEVARYGLTAQAVLQLVESLGTKPVGEVVEGQLRFPLVLRLPDSYRTNKAAVEGLLVSTPGGERVPVGRLAAVEVVEGPSTITREWGQRRITVTCNVRGRDLGSFVEEARRKVSAEVKLPVGRYRLDWGGQYEHLIRAKRRLMVVVPLAFVLIFGLLYATYQSWADAVRVFSAVPFAWVGGLIALWVRGLPFSVSAAVGFVALSGVAVLDDMILVSAVRKLRADGLSLDGAVTQAAKSRLRPVLMTTLVAALGFVPMAVSTGVGAEVQRPLATVVIGGVIGSFVMSLLVLRVLYLVFSRATGGAKVSSLEGG